MWRHKTKFKNQTYLGNYEYTRAGYRKFVLKNSKTGRELTFKSHEHAKLAGFGKILKR